MPRPRRLHTLLGSCVSIILWHPERRIGGMSHIILPECVRRNASPALDGRYCDGAISLFLDEIRRTGTRPMQYSTYLVGGGRMYNAPTLADGDTVGQRNILMARQQLKAAGFLIRAEDVGQDGYRKVELDLNTGAVNVMFGNQRRTLST